MKIAVNILVLFVATLIIHMSVYNTALQQLRPYYAGNGILYIELHGQVHEYYIEME